MLLRNAEWEALTPDQRREHLDGLSDIEIRDQATVRAAASMRSVWNVLGAWVACGYLTLARAQAAASARREAA